MKNTGWVVFLSNVWSQRWLLYGGLWLKAEKPLGRMWARSAWSYSEWGEILEQAFALALSTKCRDQPVMRTELEVRIQQFWTVWFLLFVSNTDGSIWGWQKWRCKGFWASQLYCRREGATLLLALKADHVQGSNFTYRYSQVRQEKWNDIFVLKNLGCLSSGKENNRMMLTIISGGRLLVS